MYLLLDTSTAICRVTIVSVDNVYHEYEWQADRTLARNLLAYLRDTLLEHGAQVEDLSGIGVFRGPGSFTGLRIGVAVMNTLADSASIPIVGAVGDTWRDVALERLVNGEDDTIVLPFYGRDARITTPRK